MNTKAPFSLYIHWPFCSKKCHYCEFVALEQHEDYQEAYHKSLLKEINLYAQSLEGKGHISTIFIGGGTPSLYDTEWMEELFATLHHNFDLSDTSEIAMESNPADITEEKLDAWLELGINRLSIGVQVLDDDILFKLNRRQRTRDVLNAMRIAPKYFENISADLILGLPEVSQATWDYTIQEAMSWPLKHISMYFLTVHEKTPLYFGVQRGDIKLASETEIVENYKKTVDIFAQHGFEQYETSNYAKPGYTSIHNQAYWERKPYKGCGIGAASFDGKTRFVNEKNLHKYINAFEKNNSAKVWFTENLTPEQEKIETLMLGLRQVKGMDLHRMVYLLEGREKSNFFNVLALLETKNLIVKKDDKICLTQKGRLLENDVILQLI